MHPFPWSIEGNGRDSTCCRFRRAGVQEATGTQREPGGHLEAGGDRYTAFALRSQMSRLALVK